VFRSSPNFLEASLSPAVLSFSTLASCAFPVLKSIPISLESLLDSAKVASSSVWMERLFSSSSKTFDIIGAASMLRFFKADMILSLFSLMFCI
jgi:hypothetical protein